MKKRHVFFWAILRPLVILFLKLRFGYRYQKPKNLPKNYIVVANHATDYDMLLVAAAFPKQMYFVGSEHISRWKLLYPFLRFAFAPILRYKGMLATSGVKEILQRTRKGGNVCLFAEGVRTWDGCPSPILPSTASLIKRAGCGLVTYRLIGGYFVSPVWSGPNLRRGELRGEPVNVYTKEQIDTMTNDELYAAILRDVGEDAYARQQESPKRYRGKRLAEGLDRVLYLCPSCRQNGTLHAEGDEVRCEGCAMTFRYDEYGMLTDCPHPTVKDFVAWQREEIEKDVREGMIYRVPHAKLSLVEKHDESIVAEGELAITPEKLSCGGFSVLLSELFDLAIHGRNALVFTANKNYYELILPSGSALKFVDYFRAVRKLGAEIAK